MLMISARRFIVMGASRPTSTGLFQTAIKQSSILHKVQSRNSSTTTTSSIISNVNSAQSSSSAAGEALMKIGDLKSHGLCNMTPPGMIEGLLEMIHVTGGLSWCATIIGTTFAVRLLLMPLMISSQRLMARLQMLKPQTDEMKVKMDVAKGRGDTEEMKRIQMLMMELYSKHDANPLGGLKVGLISGPIMASFFLALRDISALKMPALTSGGMLWFTDLSVADPYYVLPALACGSFLYAFEKGVETGQQQPAFMKNIMRGLCVIGFPFMASYSSVSLYTHTHTHTLLPIQSFKAAAVNLLNVFRHCPSISSRIVFVRLECLCYFRIMQFAVL
jgi:YidC/Oxa1 family membrane protein insertase